MNRSIRVAPWLALALFASGAAVAQDERERGTQAERSAEKPQVRTGERFDGQGQGEDAKLAALLLLDNEMEVELARIAQERAESDEVKDFARRMVQEHQQLAQELKPIAGALATAGKSGRNAGNADLPWTGSDPATAGARTSGGLDDTDPPRGRTQGEHPERDRVGGGIGSGAAAGANVAADRATGNDATVDLALVQELGDKHLDSMRRMLTEKSGDEFDRCYVGSQVMMHQMAADKIEVFRNHASPELRTLLDRAQTVVRTHLEHAKRLEQELAGDAG